MELLQSEIIYNYLAIKKIDKEALKILVDTDGIPSKYWDIIDSKSNEELSILVDETKTNIEKAQYLSHILSLPIVNGIKQIRLDEKLKETMNEVGHYVIQLDRKTHAGGGMPDHEAVRGGVIRHVTSLSKGMWSVLVKCPGRKFKAQQRWYRVGKRKSIHKDSKNIKYGIVLQDRSPPAPRPIDDGTETTDLIQCKIDKTGTCLSVIGVDPLKAGEIVAGLRPGWTRERMISRIWDAMIRKRLNKKAPFHGAKTSFILSLKIFSNRSRVPRLVWIK